MKSPQLGMLIKYYVNDSCKAAKQPGWYFKPILFRSDSSNMKGNQAFSLWLWVMSNESLLKSLVIHAIWLALMDMVHIITWTDSEDVIRT